MDYKKVLRLRFVNRLSCREIAESCGDCGKISVNEFLKRFDACPELTYPLSEDVTNEYRQSGYFIRKMSPYAHAVVGLCPINHVPDGVPKKAAPNHKATEKAVQNLGVRGKYVMKPGAAQRFLSTDTSHSRLTDGNGKY